MMWRPAENCTLFPRQSPLRPPNAPDTHPCLLAEKIHGHNSSTDGKKDGVAQCHVFMNISPITLHYTPATHIQLSITVSRLSSPGFSLQLLTHKSRGQLTVCWSCHLLPDVSGSGGVSGASGGAPRGSSKKARQSPCMAPLTHTLCQPCRQVCTTCSSWGKIKTICDGALPEW